MPSSASRRAGPPARRWHRGPATDVHSSARSTPQPVARVRARHRRWASPPDSDAVSRSRYPGSSPTRSSSAAAAAVAQRGGGAQVVHARARERRRALEDHAHLAAQRDRVQVGQVRAPEPDRARGGDLQPVAQAQQGGLPAARRPGDGGDPAVRDGAGDARPGSVAPEATTVTSRRRSTAPPRQSRPWQDDAMALQHRGDPQAFDHYQDVARPGRAVRAVGPWADLFTEDAVYIEHLFGEFEGREEIREWITAPRCRMAQLGVHLVPDRVVHDRRGPGLGDRPRLEPSGGPGRRLHPPGVQPDASCTTRATAGGPSRRTSTTRRSSPWWSRTGWTGAVSCGTDS